MGCGMRDVGCEMLNPKSEISYPTAEKMEKL